MPVCKSIKDDKKYIETMEEIQAYQDEREFRFYIQGRKDSMRFLINMAT